MEPALSFLGPLAELIQDEDVKEKLLEAARTFFTSSTVTVNLLPAALAAGAALLLAIPLVGLLFPGLLEGLLGGGGGSDTVSSGYGAPATGYGAPESSYGAPSSSYESQYRSDDQFEEFRSLLNDSEASLPQSQLTKRMQQLAKPLVNHLGGAAAKLIQ